MKIALLGATGQTGEEFLKLALDQGYEVKALARSQEKISMEHEKLEWIIGDVLKRTDVEKLVSKTEAVVSLFGHVKGSPERLQTEGTINILSAMSKEGIDRIISLSGGALPFPEKDQPKMVDKIFGFAMKLFAKAVVEDAVAHAEVLRQSSTKWTIVRGPRLTNDEAKGDYKETWVGVNSGTKIARKDLASFILKVLENDLYVKQMPFVSY